MPSLTFTDGDDIYEVMEPGSFDLTFLAGADTLVTRHGDGITVADMGDGNDQVSHRAGTAEVAGGAGADRFDVFTSGFVGDAGGDDDLVNIRGGTGVTVTGGIGNDRFNFYGATIDILLHGNAGDDDFFGYGQEISGSLYGGDGNDYFVGFIDGGVTLYGGTGNDIYRADASSPATFVEQPGEGTDSVQVARGADHALGDNLERISVQGFSGSTSAAAVLTGNVLANTITAHNNIDTLHGLDGNDRLLGKGANDLVHGGNGNDYLDGGPGDDTLEGGNGNDTLNGRAGADLMAGGDGVDLYYVDDAGDIVTEVSGGTGYGDAVRSSLASYVLPDEIEIGIIELKTGASLTGNGEENYLQGNAGNDIIHGADGGDEIRGGTGDDQLHGDGGQDLLHGGAGNDVLSGGSDDDHLVGFDGADVLIGGAGADWMDGEGGADTYVYVTAADSVLAAEPDGYPQDVLVFEHGIDAIDLSQIDADSSIAGNQAFAFVDAPTGIAGEVWIVADGSGAAGQFYLCGDTNGDGSADLFIYVASPGGLDSDDLIL